MTGFDPTAPARDTDDDQDDTVPDNVVPAEELVEQTTSPADDGSPDDEA